MTKSIDVPEYEYITSESRARGVISELHSAPYLAVDTETTGLDPYTSKLFIAQINNGTNNYIFDLRYDTEFSNIHPSLLNSLWENKRIPKILQNALFDMKMIKVHGGVYISNVFDTMLLEQLITLGLLQARANLKAIVEKYIGVDLPKEPRSTFSPETYPLPLQPYQLEYAVNDVVFLKQILDMQMITIQKEGLLDVAQLEFDFLKPMCEMELNGISMDTDKWKVIMGDVENEANSMAYSLSKLLASTEDQTTLFGTSLINIDSNVQLLKALHKYGLSNVTDTNAKTLDKYSDLPVVSKIIDYRTYKKLFSTYGQSLLDQINPVTGRLHTEFKQMVKTGRMSSSNPNLQNIPHKQKFRSGFVAKDGYSLIKADAAGCELRILGNLSQDPIFIDSYAKGLDLHKVAATMVYGCAYDKVTTNQRSAVKAIGFGLCVQEDSILFSEQGLTKIKNVDIDGVVSHDMGSNIVIDKKFMGKKPVFRLTTEFGYFLDCTEDHLVKVINSEGDYVDKQLKDIDIQKDFPCIKIGSMCFNKNIYKLKSKKYKDFTSPAYLTEDWASFIGLCLGSVPLIEKGIKYNMDGKDEIFEDEVDTLFSKLFSPEDIKKQKKSASICYKLNNQGCIEWLKDAFLKKEPTIPVEIKNSPKEIQSCFFKWFTSKEGVISKSGNMFVIKYISGSKTLLRDIQMLFINFGILTSLEYQIVEIDSKDVYIYSLSVIAESSKERFITDIGFVNKYKNSVPGIVISQSVYYVPNQKKRTDKIVKKFEAARCIDKVRYDAVYNASHDPKGVGNRYIKALGHYDKFFDFIADNNIVPLKTVSIKPVGLKNVYDISVDKHPYFLANGFITHNCYGLSKYGLARRLRISEDDAEVLINKYFNSYKGIKKYLDMVAKSAVDRGYSTSISGRRRHYNMPPHYDPDFNKISKSIQRQGMNMPVQGSNADFIKKSMVYVVDRIEKANLDAKLLLSVHDEIIVESHNGCVQESADIVKSSLIDGFAYYFSTIPMETDAIIGPCWVKDPCENLNEEGKKCGCTNFEFAPDAKYGTKLVCAKCGGKCE